MRLWGVLWFDMWQKRQKAIFIYQKSPKPGVLHTPCLFPGCPWAVTHCHTQLPALHRGADWSHQPGNLQVSPFLGSFLVSFIPHMDTIPSWDQAGPCYLSCANGRCSTNLLKFYLPFSFQGSALSLWVPLTATGNPNISPLPAELIFYFSQFPFSPEHCFYACPVCCSVDIIPLFDFQVHLVSRQGTGSFVLPSLLPCWINVPPAQVTF